MHQPANTLIQMVKVKALCADLGNAEAVAAAEFGENSTAARLIRKELISSDSLHLDGDWRAAQRGFLELVRSRSLIGKIAAVSGFHKLPALVPTLRQTTPLMASWVAQGQPIATTAASFERITKPQQRIWLAAGLSSSPRPRTLPGNDFHKRGLVVSTSVCT